MANVNEALQQATEEIESASARLFKTRDRLKSELANDVASVASSATKITAQMQKISASVAEVQRQLTSTEMVAAVANAERLAAALAAINAIHSHKITFAVIDSGKPQT